MVTIAKTAQIRLARRLAVYWRVILITLESVNLAAPKLRLSPKRTTSGTLSPQSSQRPNHPGVELL